MNKTNLLRNTQCYLIGHMEFSNGEEWRDNFEEFATRLGIKIWNPYKKLYINDVPEDEESRAEMKRWMETEQYDLVHERMKRVRSLDLRCCDKCDWCVAVIKPKIASWGSAEELFTVIKQKKPIFLVIDDPKGKKATPLWIMGSIPHKYIYNNIEEVKEVVLSIDSGKIKINNERWKLLLPELR